MKDDKFQDRKMKFVKSFGNKYYLRKFRGCYVSSISTQELFKTSVIRKFLTRAREEIGYSKKTVDVDILNSLISASRRAEYGKK